ncbi:MAG: penicillin-binding protein 2 [Myxococcota bacterium]
MALGHQTAGRDYKTRYLVLGAAMLAGLLVLAINLYRLQIVRGEEFLAKSKENHVKVSRIRADRGMIKDRRGEILVDVRPSFDVLITPAFCQRCATEVLPKLATWLGWDESQRARVEQQVRAVNAAKGPSRFQPITVRADLTRDELDVVAAHESELDGVDVVAVPHRNYRAGSVLAHAVGYMNEVTQEELDRLNANGGDYALGDYIGRRGIERALESRLRGVDGRRKEVVDARGRPWCKKEDDELMRCTMGLLGDEDTVPPKPGNNVVLSIDARLQAEAERAFPGTAGAVLMVEVKTGFLLTFLSRPAFDPNMLTGRISPAQMAAIAKDPLQPMISRPVGQHYSPGSTFKTISMLAALRSKVFTPRTQTNCPGGYRLGSRVWRCHKDSGHGPMDARLALQKSCDTYFYRVADTLGIDAIAREAKELGLGAPTGIGVLAEVSGIMPDTAYHDRVTPGGYTKGMALNTVIGQGDVNVTPLQLLMAYAAVANGGTLYQPQLVRRIEAPDGHLLEELQPKMVRQVPMDAEDRRVVIDALTAVVNEPGGTAFRTRLKEVVVAGKTGTAQVARLGTVRLKTEEMSYFQRDHAWFVAFAPADDPEVAIVVLNEHGGHGGSDAAPTAAAVLQKYFDLKKGDAAAFGTPPPKGDGRQLASTPPSSAPVP